MSGMQIFLVSVGGVALVLGALIAVMRIRTIYFGSSAEGVVVGQSTSSGGKVHGRIVTMFNPIVEFHHAGKKHKFTSSMGTREAIGNGTKVTVRYLPADPDSSAEIGTSMRMWGFPIGMLLFGGLFIGLGLFAPLK
ncbi:MAG: DUF3592 domain-containing protein [Betaproteobacteria bacterium]